VLPELRESSVSTAMLQPECEKPQATITKFRFPNTKVTTKNLL
jgi:hypothetical protein